MNPLKATIPITAVEWSDKYFRLPEGSSQIAGAWVTQPLQVALLNMMTNDSIRLLAIKKSARLGYTKMMVAALLYLAEHKKRSAVVYQPVDDESDAFVVDEVDPVIEEMPIIQRIFPDWNVKSENNKVSKKVMIGSTIDFRGATAPGNYRRLTKQVLIGDEVNAWPLEVGKKGKGEGNPIKLALQRLKGASFPKAIFGTTPTVAGNSHISNILEDCDLVFRFYLPCPHCGTEQVLEFGERDGELKEYGLLWDDTQSTTEKKSRTAHYKCVNTSECGQSFHYSDLTKMELAGKWIAEDLTWTKDGLQFFTEHGYRTQPPKNVGIEINALYSLNLDGWGEIVAEWLKAKGKPANERSFINTVLGQDYEDKSSEKLDDEILFERREKYKAQVPERAVFLTGGIDSQRNRYELFVWGWGPNDEKWLVDKQIIMGDYDKESTLKLVDKAINKTYKRANGTEMTVARWCWDTGGIDPDIVNKRSKKHGLFRVIPIKGANVYGKPIANFPLKRNKNGVYHTEIGTDTAKDLLYLHMENDPLDPASEPDGLMHLPINDDICDKFTCQQLASERLIEKSVSGKKVLRWDNEGRRNEALDCLVYALAALRISTSRFGINLNELAKTPSTGGSSSNIDIEAIGAG
ncbi:terminase gpA endonuclease subunit [Pseudoalteromonas sp. GW168-MNA-CIBAN-0100]|uniref:phage terminase large subunit family protein n=1 Tax=Pseudoalteromonas sp. GW168-MNA-CIBAN-0100 TaxID=3140434 RepID=UPI0033343E74